MNGEKYLVKWYMEKKFKKRGILNRFFGKKIQKVMPMTFQYDSEEVADYGYNYIKNNGGVKPYLLKVIKS